MAATLRRATFVFAGHDLDTKKGLARFYFELQTPRQRYRFTETLRFPARPIRRGSVPPALLTNILNNLSLALGISYWKLYCPREINIATFALAKPQARFWDTLYTKGLGEFFYKNKIDFRGLAQFPYGSRQTRTIKIVRENRSLLLLGGGKDSIVSAEFLKAKKKPFALFMLNDSPVQRNVARLIGADTIVITRNLDPQLFELNKGRDTFNGHIPISAIYAFAGLLAAVLYDYRSVIASNEKSANYGNARHLGDEINHQWSKSLEFERMFQEYARRFITPDIAYHSFLRPWREIEIIEMFAKYPRYFSAFSSCNANFKLTGEKSTKKWCGHCPKCAFVFAGLAAYLPKKEVVKIFRKNLFADKTLIPAYQELLGLKKFKPFECVGTPEETREVFAAAFKRGQWNDDAVMKFFARTHFRGTPPNSD